MIRNQPKREGGYLAMVTFMFVVAGCSAPAPTAREAPRPFDIVHSHPLIEVGVDPSLPICGRSMEYIDRFVERYVDASSYGSYDEPATFYYLAPEHAEEICGRMGCAGGGFAYSSWLTHPHELVHVIRQHQQVPRSHRFFEEGAAQLHDASIRPHWPDGFEISDALQFADDVPGTHYDQAGHLMSYVRHRYSYAAVETLLDEMADITTADEIEEGLVAALGVGIDQLETDYRETYPHCDGIGWSEMLAECSDEPLPWEVDADGRRFIEELIPDFACEHPEAIGPAEGRVWTSFTFDIEEPEAYLVQVPGIEGMHFELGSCDLGCDRAVTLQSNYDELSIVVEFPAGRHVVRLSRKLDEPGRIGFRMLGASP